MTMKVVSALEDRLLPASALQMTLMQMQKRKKKLTSKQIASIPPPQCIKWKLGPDKTKEMINDPNGVHRDIKIKGQRLEAVENFMYQGSIISNDRSKLEFFPDCPGNSSSFQTEHHMDGQDVSLVDVHTSSLPVRAGP